MLDITNKTIGEIFGEAVNLWPNEIFFISPNTKDLPGAKISYIEALRKVVIYEKKLTEGGYGYGERIALLLGNKVDHYLIKLAANNLGISVVPINPDLSPNEILYILDDSKTILTFTNQIHLSLMENVKKMSEIDEIRRKKLQKLHFLKMQFLRFFGLLENEKIESSKM